MSVKIGMHIIVKEESDRIQGCLESFMRLVDVFVIAVDSKPESDSTFEIAQKVIGDRGFVYRQVWQDDFSIARNDALENLLTRYPDIDYVFWADGDDILALSGPGVTSPEEIKKRLGEQLPDSVQGPYVYGMDFVKEGVSPNLKYYRNRFWRHIKGSPKFRYWKGPIHECDVMNFSTGRGDVVWEDFVIIHLKGEARPQNSERNLRVLEAAHVKDPTDARTMYYLGREYKDSRQYEKSIAMLIKYLHKSNFPEEKYDAMLLIARMYQSLGNLESALEWAKKALDFKPEIAFAPTLIGDIYLSSKQSPDLARPWYAYAAYAPHGNVLFDDLPARTYIPHKWLAFCSSQVGDMDRAYYHHKISKSMAPLDGDVRFNDIWFNDNSSRDYPPVFQSVVDLADSDSGFESLEQLIKSTLKVSFVTDQVNLALMQSMAPYDVLLMDLSPNSPVLRDFGTVTSYLSKPGLLVIKEMTQKNLSSEFATLLRGTANLKLIRNYRATTGNALFVLE
jgi:tetratricopeptide (TPR) repeat protein